MKPERKIMEEFLDNSDAELYVKLIKVLSLVGFWTFNTTNIVILTKDAYPDTATNIDKHMQNVIHHVLATIPLVIPTNINDGVSRELAYEFFFEMNNKVIPSIVKIEDVINQHRCDDDVNDEKPFSQLIREIMAE